MQRREVVGQRRIRKKIQTHLKYQQEERNHSHQQKEKVEAEKLSLRIKEKRMQLRISRQRQIREGVSQRRI